jgi:hypothetical protein
MNIRLRSVRAYSGFAVAAIFHSAIVLLLWLPAMNTGSFLVSPRFWLALGWLWLVWPIILAFHPERSVRRFSVPVVIGIALLIPCVPFLAALTAWSIRGFAP